MFKIYTKEARFEKKLVEHVANESPKVSICLGLKDANVVWFGKHIHSEDHELLRLKKFKNRIPGAEFLH